MIGWPRAWGLNRGERALLAVCLGVLLSVQMVRCHRFRNEEADFMDVPVEMPESGEVDPAPGRGEGGEP